MSFKKKKPNNNKDLDDRPLTEEELIRWEEQLEYEELQELRQWATIAERAMVSLAEENRELREQLETALEQLERLTEK